MNRTANSQPFRLQASIGLPNLERLHVDLELASLPVQSVAVLLGRNFEKIARVNCVHRVRPPEPVVEPDGQNWIANQARTVKVVAGGLNMRFH